MRRGVVDHCLQYFTIIIEVLETTFILHLKI